MMLFRPKGYAIVMLAVVLRHLSQIPLLLSCISRFRTFADPRGPGNMGISVHG